MAVKRSRAEGDDTSGAGASGGPLTISFLDEGEPEPKTLAVSEELARAVTVAGAIGERPFPVSFTSLFIGLASGSDRVGAWVRERFRADAHLEALLERSQLSRARFDELSRGPVVRVESPLPRTRSARVALDEAEKLARDTHAPTDTRHAMAAYLLLPGYHEKEFQAWNVDRTAWTVAFARAMTDAYPEERTFWQGFSSIGVAEPTAGLVLDDNTVEPHVGSALRLAQKLAGKEPIRPHDVIIAVTKLAPTAKSRAFTRLADIVALETSRSAREPDGPLPGPEDLSEALRLNLEWAQRPRPGTSDLRRIWGRDLVTAALLCPDDQLAAALEKVNRPIDVIRDRWYEFVKLPGDKRRSAAEWTAWWLRAGMALPGPVRAGHYVDSAHGVDKLEITREAEAFARLILDKDLEPPLSIGLLGDWGSGKSFFIQEIKNQIAAQTKNRRPELYSDPVEIEFNAWHASDANLWASLVTDIFDKIWERVDESPSPEKMRQSLLAAIQEAGGAMHEAESRLEEARTALATAEEKLRKQREELGLRKFVTQAALEQLERLGRRVGLGDKALETINEVEEAAKSLASSGNRLRLAVASLAQRPILNIAVPTAFLILVTVGLWVLCEELVFQVEWRRKLAKAAAVVLGGLSTVVTPLKLASAHVSALAKKLTDIKDDEGVQVKLAKERSDLTVAETGVNAARAHLEELLSQEAALDPTRRLNAFLRERVQSTLYRSQQGIISLVHKDFRQLSDHIKKLRESAKGTTSSEAGIKRLERIVIYIDDLDRCRPEHVVQMLEATHLLLALDLFVVVVAVDSRWLIRALEVHYKDLLKDDGGSEGLRASTPQSYLEKIFQVTYALGPMDPEHFKHYVEFLAGAEKREETPGTEESSSAGENKETPKELATGGAPASGAAATSGGGTNQAEPAGKTVKGASPASASPSAQAVRIDGDEQELICDLVPLIPTPRIAKRLVNVYRLIKSSKSIGELESFQKEKRAESCLLMLAIMFGRPAAASKFFRMLNEREEPFDDPKRTLLEALKLVQLFRKEPAYLHQEWSNLLSTLEGLKIERTVEECAREPIEIARYSLSCGHDWHLWTRQSSSALSRASRRTGSSV